MMAWLLILLNSGALSVSIFEASSYLEAAHSTMANLSKALARVFPSVVSF
jgi:hypothetical protein